MEDTCVWHDGDFSNSDRTEDMTENCKAIAEQTPWSVTSKDPWLRKFPRVNLVPSATPLEYLANLSSDLAGPRIYIKRDDNTGFAMGGNKVRQMEFYFGDVLASGADTVISTSAAQSNHLRVISAAAAKFGLKCEIQRENRVAGMDADYHRSGNALLQDLFGARIHHFPVGEDEEAADAELENIASGVTANGGSPYIIGLGPNYPHLGALGYVDAAREILEQASEQNIQIDAIVLPTGSAATHAGMLVGLRAHGHKARVYGICVRRNHEAQRERVWQRILETEAMIGREGLVHPEDIWVSDSQLGPSYGQSTPEMIHAIRTLAEREGVLLDPVYSGKAMAGLFELSREGVLKPDWNVIFLHTGGLPALFAYQSLFDKGE